MGRLQRIAFIATLALFGCRDRSDAAPMATAQSAPPRELPTSVSAQRRTPIVVAVHNVSPAVVNIQAEGMMRQQDPDPFFGSFFNRDRVVQTRSLGSGFVWNTDGIIVTNAHVIEGASSITVNLQDGRQLKAKVIGTDPDSDLAVLKVDASNLGAAPIGTSSDLMIGESVIAVGNPFGLSGSVTTGVVSATGRSVPSKEQGRTYTDFIQTDASINPGNSGGPLLNIEGRVIGINTAIYAQAQGIGFAIPVDRARKVVEDLRRFGEVHAAWLGAVTTTLTPEEAKRLGIEANRGALVTRTFAGSPALSAGLRVGDVITAIDGANIDSREGLNTAMATATTTNSVRLSLSRNGKPVEVSIRPAEPPKDLGLRILHDVIGIDAADARGTVQVDAVTRGSQAERTGLAAGDLIVGANGVEVTSVERLNSALRSAADRSSIVLNVARGRFVYTLTFPMSSQAMAADEETF